MAPLTEEQKKRLEEIDRIVALMREEARQRIAAMTPEERAEMDKQFAAFFEKMNS